MPSRDLHSRIKVVQMIDPIVGNNTTEGTPGAGLDTRGFSSAELIAYFGVSGDTLSGSVYVEVILEESDDDSTWTAVTDSNHAIVGSDSVSAAPDANGVIATIDDAAEDATTIRCGYVGDKRYCRLKLAFTGTHTSGMPIASLGVLSDGDMPQTD